MVNLRAFDLIDISYSFPWPPGSIPLLDILDLTSEAALAEGLPFLLPNECQRLSRPFDDKLAAPSAVATSLSPGSSLAGFLGFVAGFLVGFA